MKVALTKTARTLTPYPEGLIRAFTLLKTESAFEMDAETKDCENLYQLEDFPRLFRDALFEGLTQAPHLGPAEEWLARDIVDLKLFASPKNSYGLFAIVTSFNAEIRENPDLTFGDWFKSWFKEDCLNANALLVRWALILARFPVFLSFPVIVTSQKGICYQKCYIRWVRDLFLHLIS